jgi:hypothetical protein
VKRVNGPIYKLTWDNTNPYFETALNANKSIYYANTPGWDCSKINFYSSEYGFTDNLKIGPSNFQYTNDLPGIPKRDRFKFAEQQVPENEDDWVENWPHFLHTQLSPTFFTRGQFTFTVDIVLNRCIYNAANHFLYLDNYSAFSLYYYTGVLRFNYIKAPKTDGGNDNENRKMDLKLTEPFYRKNIL